MIFIPEFVYRLCHGASIYGHKIYSLGTSISHWFDAHFLPLPEKNINMLHIEQMKVEEAANFIQVQLSSCYLLSQTYCVLNMIETFKRTHGDSVQVNSQVDSLRLETRNKMELLTLKYKR
jgi:hypothetical protein